jgi:predicted component of type VI protein secretion system
MVDSPISEVLLVIAGSQVRLGHGQHVVGRSIECDVCLDDPRSSRRHAVIAIGSDRVAVRDLGSTNGVVVNGERIDAPRQLDEGDKIAIGSEIILVRRIRRAGAASSIPPGPKRAKTAPTPLHEPEDPTLSRAMRAATTLSHSLAPPGQAVEAFGLVIEAGAKALAEGRAERAEKLLEPVLVEVLATLRAGIPVESGIVALAAEQAARLFLATHKMPWLEYVYDLYDKLGAPIPPHVAALLAQAEQG